MVRQVTVIILHLISFDLAQKIEIITTHILVAKRGAAVTNDDVLRRLSLFSFHLFLQIISSKTLNSANTQFSKETMASSTGDSWMKEYNDAAKLADDVSSMISEKTSVSGPGSESKRHFSALRRKITILGTRLDSLDSLLAKLPSKKSITEKELNRRKDMLSNLRSKAKQMANSLNMSNFGNRDVLLGPEIKPVDAMTRIAGLDNQGVVGLQRQIMREQDEGLEQLEESVMSTKHIALAVNEELNLHTRLIDTLDEHVEVSGSRLQRISRSLGVLNRRTKNSCSCLCLMLSVSGIVIVILALFVLIKYL